MPKKEECYIGIDENAIGCLAGPLSVGAVFLNGFSHPLIRDSKRISKANSLYKVGLAIEKNTVSVVRFASVECINALGTWKSWEKVVNEVIFIMRSKVGFDVPVILDGCKLPKGQYLIEAITKADVTHKAVSAASIVSKMRSRYYMSILHKKYPNYNFANNCGYGTEQHLLAIEEHGLTPHHRNAATFTALNNRLKRAKK